MNVERNATGTAPGEPNRPHEAGTPPIVLQVPQRSFAARWMTRLLALALGVCVLVIVSMYYRYKEYFAAAEPPQEKFYSGEKDAKDKIALLEMTGTIMPPFTKRTIKAVKRAREDESVKAAILVIDSPGGLVADSHQIYHELQKLRKKKPMAVVMKRTAASGGYYVAMGAGPDSTIYAEPTTWTGSIGVIIPRYNATVLATQKLGVRSEPIKTGPYKDSLSPFRDLREDERLLWEELVDDSFDRFLQVVADNRSRLARKDPRLLGWNAAAGAVLQKTIKQPPERTVEHYATGRVFTAAQAKQAGLIDKIGYLDDAIEELKTKADLKEARVVRYQFPSTLLGLLTGMAKAQQPEWHWRHLRNMTVPQPMYYCSSLPLPPLSLPDDE